MHAISDPGKMQLIFLKYFLALFISSGSYFLVELVWNGQNFMLLYIVHLVSVFAMIFLYRRLFGRDIWRYLPSITSLYIVVALFVSTIFIYYSDFLKGILDWDDYLVIKSLSLGLIFIQFLWTAYLIGTLLMPVKISTPKIHILPLSKIYLLFLFGLLANFLAIITGTFGVLQNTNIQSTANYSAYIDLGQHLGLFGLIILTYQYTHRKYLIAFAGLTFFVLGIISAQKQAALMPLLAIGVTLYFKYGKVPKGAIIITLAGLFISFAAVTTIRQYYFDSKSSGVTSVFQVKEISQNALNQKVYNKAYASYNLNEHLLIRFFYGSAIAKAVNYCERHSFGVPSNSAFYQIFFAPIYAVVPRIIMPDKPESTFGNLFASEVFLGYKVKYSIGITPVGYGYMVNGLAGVIMVALVLGLFMAFLFKTLYVHHFYIYVLIFIKSVLPADVTWEYIAGNIKVILVYWIILKLLEVRIFRKSPIPV